MYMNYVEMSKIKKYFTFLFCVSFALTLLFPFSQPCVMRDMTLYARLLPHEAEQMGKIQDEASRHWLYQYIPRHRSLIPWWALSHWCTWAFLGNDDDGLFGEGHHALYWKASEPSSCKKALLWFLRNPLHNFTFYVIGSAWTENSEVTLVKIAADQSEFFTYSPRAKTIFFSENSSLFIGLHGWKPFISLRILYSNQARGDFFVGWRERGNFGIKCIPITTSVGLANKFKQNMEMGPTTTTLPYEKMVVQN